MTICDALLFAPKKTLSLFDGALVEAQSVVMETHKNKEELVSMIGLALYLIETPFNTLANRANSDQAALVRAA